MVLGIDRAKSMGGARGVLVINGAKGMGRAKWLGMGEKRGKGRKKRYIRDRTRRSRIQAVRPA